jgi:hypothetical protein
VQARFVDTVVIDGADPRAELVVQRLLTIKESG